jgi:hypothetical protein
LNLACTRLHEARLEALKTAFSALKTKVDSPSLTIIERAAARIKIEDQRRLRIIAALKQKRDSAKAA